MQGQGYARMNILKNAGIHTRKISSLLESGVIEKIKAGLYRLSDYPFSSERDNIELCLAIPKAVICLHSALSYYELVTIVPSRVMLAFPQGFHSPKIINMPFDRFFFSKNMHDYCVEVVKTNHGSFRIYSKEKSICDTFRFRNKLGIDPAIECLVNYMKDKNRNVQLLIEVAKKCRMHRIMAPYIEARL